MKTLDCISRFFMHFKYPVSLPVDIAEDVGLSMPSNTTLEQILSKLTSPACRLTRLRKLMPRHYAEEVFASATSKERFRECSLYSYFFPGGWLEFKLIFDKQSRLRRIYLQHRRIKNDQGFEIPI